MAFSEHFLDGLATKSEGFQNEFFGIMNMLYFYLEYDDEKVQELDKMIEKEISYYGKGNILWWLRSGNSDVERSEECLGKLYKQLANEFATENFFHGNGEDDLGNGILIASNIIIATTFPEEVMTEEEIRQLYLLVYTSRCMDAPDNPPPRVTIINNPNAEDASYCIVTMR